MSDQSRQNFNTCTIAMLLLEGFNSTAAHAFIDPFRAADGSYRLVNELTHVIATKAS